MHHLSKRYVWFFILNFNIQLAATGCKVSILHVDTTTGRGKHERNPNTRINQTPPPPPPHPVPTPRGKVVADVPLVYALGVITMDLLSLTVWKQICKFRGKPDRFLPERSPSIPLFRFFSIRDN